MKRNLKRLFSLLLVACMILSMMPASVIAEGTTSQEGTSAVIGDSAISEESANEENTPEEITTEDNLSEEDNSEDASSEENNSEDNSSEENNSEDASSQENNSDDNSSKENNSDDNSSEEDSSEEDSSEDITSETDDSETDEDSSAVFAKRPGGGMETSEEYFNASNSFGYDSFTSGGNLSGVKYVTVGGTSLSRGSASTTTGAAASGVTRIGFNPGWYLYRWKVVCGDKYSCRTDAAGNAANASNVMSGASEAYYDLYLTKAQMGHSSRKAPYWLLIELKEDTTKYPVTYNWGILEGTLTNDAPEGGEYTVSTVVTVQSPSAAAISEAAAIDYEFVGWVMEYNSVSQSTSPNSTFAMPRTAVTLTAQWKVATTSFTASKVWNDSDNQDRIRPASVTVQLMQDGVEYGSPVTLSADNNWTYTWEGLPKRPSPAGNRYVYSVDEPTVPEGYTKSISESDGVITNTHVPEKISVSGSKTWVDNGNQDGKRPDSITIYLFANGNKVDSKTVTAADGWAWTFENLDKYSDGEIIVYTIEEDDVEYYTADVDGFDITNTHEIEKITISGEKSWVDNNNQDGKRPDSITIYLFANGDKVDSKTVTAEDGWKWSFQNLDKYANGEEITYTLEEEDVEDYIGVVNGFDVTNTHEVEKIDISGSKTWDDNDNQDGKRPDSITIYLLANGDKVDSKTVTAADNWAWTFEDMDKYASGEEIVYTVAEDDVDGYIAETDGCDITNTHAPEKINVSGSKTWDDNNNQDGIRPNSITIYLLANGEKVDSKTVTAADNWAWTFEDMDKYASGEEIVYTVIENDVDGYIAETDGCDVINTHAPEKISVSGSKTWDDNGNQDGIRPDSITIYLLANGEKVDSKTVTVGDNWAWTFDNLDKYAAGEEIVYTIEEEDVEDYTADVDGFDVTNSHTPATISISGEKTWVGDDNVPAGDPRPASIKVYLNANGKKVDEKTVTPDADGKWTYSFENVPKFADGEEIVYTITEEQVTGYTFSNGTNYDIVNTYTPGKTSVTVTKSWDDGSNQDGIRPESVTVQLKLNLLVAQISVGEPVELNAANQWTHTFTDLDATYLGLPLSYTVTEVNTPEDYTSIVTGNQNDGYTITNTHEVEKIDISGEKTWVDNGNQDGKRPDSITIYLLANGDKVASKIVTAADGWAWTFEDMDKFAAGEEIVYTIEEEDVDDYTADVDGFDIINTHEIEKIDISGEKTWVDNGNQDGIRPDSITVNLMANGKKVASVTVSAEDGWAWTFEDMDKFAAGEEIVYTIEEEDVEGYTADVDGFNIINTHEIEKIDISGEKTWDDNGNQDGIRPDSITIYLFANGDKIDSKTVTAEDGWAWTFEDLDKYAAGEEIVYTIEEEDVEDYTATVDGFNVTNTHEPETIEISGSKTWVDNGNQDGIRPKSITVNLMANGDKVDSKTVTAADNWAWTFEDLDKFAAGEEIVYTIEEAAVAGYTSIVDGFNVTNTHAPQLMNIPVSKQWVDISNKTGIRPATVSIYLMADGVPTGDVLVLSSANGWTGAFTNLPVNKDGKAIQYTIVEKGVTGYSSKITGNASSGFVVTNTLVTIPVTGDDSNLTMYAVLFTFGAIVAASALILCKKKYGRRG